MYLELKHPIVNNAKHEGTRKVQESKVTAPSNTIHIHTMKVEPVVNFSCSLCADVADVKLAIPCEPKMAFGMQVVFFWTLKQTSGPYPLEFSLILVVECEKSAES